MKTKLFLISILFFLTQTALAGGDHHSKPEPSAPPPISTPPILAPASNGDDTHHESRSSKIAKVVGVVALGMVVYHVTWGGKGKQNESRFEFKATGTRQ